jgi:hypothetical protein
VQGSCISMSKGKVPKKLNRTNEAFKFVNWRNNELIKAVLRYLI